MVNVLRKEMIGSLLNPFTRLSITNAVLNSRTITTYNPLLFKLTPNLYAEPMRKKKKVDPSILKHREERRKKKLEKQIKRLERHARQLKPIDELEASIFILDEKEKRERPQVSPTQEEIDCNKILEQEWTKHKSEQYIDDVNNIGRIIASQQKALLELRNISEELYQAAVEIDETLYPYTGEGTVATPPIKNYPSPDGEYIDISKKWINF